MSDQASSIRLVNSPDLLLDSDDDIGHDVGMTVNDKTIDLQHHDVGDGGGGVALDDDDDDDLLFSEVGIGLNRSGVAKKRLTLTGTVSKWTNYIHGWQDRYFSLQSDGSLVYYKSANDTDFGCRGAICVQRVSG